MALSAEEIAHAQNLLETNERVLRVREQQIERQGDDTPPHVVLDAEDIRKKILALKAILEPELPDEISGLVKRRLEDDYFVFQTTLGAKRDVAQLREDVAEVKAEQSRASEWRMKTGQDVEELKAQVANSEAARLRTAPGYRKAMIFTVVFSILSLIVACAALVVR